MTGHMSFVNFVSLFHPPRTLGRARAREDNRRNTLTKVTELTPGSDLPPATSRRTLKGSAYGREYAGDRAYGGEGGTRSRSRVTRSCARHMRYCQGLGNEA
jgi:hypothetical protein